MTNESSSFVTEKFAFFHLVFVELNAFRKRKWEWCQWNAFIFSNNTFNKITILRLNGVLFSNIVNKHKLYMQASKSFIISYKQLCNPETSNSWSNNSFQQAVKTFSNKLITKICLNFIFSWEKFQICFYHVRDLIRHNAIKLCNGSNA